MDRSINILYRNCQKKRAATLQLNNTADLSRDVIVITEPFVGKKKENVHSKGLGILIVRTIILGQL